MSFLVSSCSIPFANGMTRELIQLLNSSLSYSPTPKKKGGTSNNPATVRLSNSTESLIARSCKDKGLTCSTSINSAGTIQGAPASCAERYLSYTSFLPSSSVKASLKESTFTIKLGIYLPLIKPFLVAVACFKL